MLARGIRAGLHARCHVHAGHVGMPPQPSSGSPSGMSRLGGSPHFSRLYLDHTSCLPGVQHCCGPACGSGHPRIARLDVPPVVAGASSGLSDKMYSSGSGEGYSGGAPRCLFPAPFGGVSWSIFFFGMLFLGLKDPRVRHHMTETCQWPQASSSTGSLVQAGRDDLDPPPEVGSRPGGVPALQTKERQKKDKKKPNKATSM